MGLKIYPINDVIMFNRADLQDGYNLYIDYTEKEISKLYMDNPKDLGFFLLTYGINSEVCRKIDIETRERAIFSDVLKKYDIINRNSPIVVSENIHNFLYDGINYLSIDTYDDSRPFLIEDNIVTMAKDLIKWNKKIGKKVIDIQIDGIKLVYDQLLDKILDRYPELESIEYGILSGSENTLYGDNMNDAPKETKFSIEQRVPILYRTIINSDINYLKLYNCLLHQPNNFYVETSGYKYKQLIFLYHLLECLYIEFGNCVNSIESTKRINSLSFVEILRGYYFSSSINLLYKNGMKRTILYNKPILFNDTDDDIFGLGERSNIQVFDSDKLTFGMYNHATANCFEKREEDDNRIKDMDDTCIANIKEKVKSFISSFDISDLEKEELLAIYDKYDNMNAVRSIIAIFKALYVCITRKYLLDKQIIEQITPYKLDNNGRYVVKVHLSLLDKYVNSLKKIIGHITEKYNYSSFTIYNLPYIYGIICKMELKIYDNELDKEINIGKEMKLTITLFNNISADTIVENISKNDLDTEDHYKTELKYPYDTIGEIYGCGYDVFDTSNVIAGYYLKEMPIVMNNAHRKNFWRVQDLISRFNNLIYDINSMFDTNIPFKGNVGDFITETAYYFSYYPYINMPIRKKARSS